MEINKILLNLVNKKNLNFPENFDWELFYCKLRENELNILFYEELRKKKYSVPKKLKEQLKKDYKKFKVFRQSLDFFLKITKENKISNYTIIKLKNIPKAHTDLDILTTKENITKLYNILTKKGFKVKDNLGFEIGLRKKVTGGEIVIDMHSKIDYNNSSFIDSQRVLEDKKIISYLDKKIPFVSPEDDFMINLVHCFFQKLGVRRTKGFNKLRWSEITLSDLVQLKEDSESKNFDWSYVIKTSKKYGWKNALTYCLMILNHFFPSDERVKIISKITPKSKVAYYNDIHSFNDLPFYTSIFEMYLISLSKLGNELNNGFFKGVKYFYNTHKWFFSNGLRVIYHYIF